MAGLATLQPAPRRGPSIPNVLYLYSSQDASSTSWRQDLGLSYEKWLPDPQGHKTNVSIVVYRPMLPSIVIGFEGGTVLQPDSTVVLLCVNSAGASLEDATPESIHILLRQLHHTSPNGHSINVIGI